MNLNKLLKNQNLRDLFSYLIVGGIATLVEWIFFYIFSYSLHINYLLATTIAFAISTAANWLAGRLLTFRHAEKQPILKELGKIYAVAIIGLGLNLLLMYLLVQMVAVPKMAAKMITTVLVFGWNFIIRKIWIYKGTNV